MGLLSVPGHDRHRAALASLRPILCAIALLVVSAVPAAARAQAVPTAERSEGLSAFATASRIYTDYGQDDWGYTLGADYTRYMRLLSPSIEARYTHSTGDAITENTFAGGLKAQKNFHRLHPYGDFLLGYGTINFIGGPASYNHDNSVVYDVGAGVDFRVTPVILVKFDAQQQFWKLGTETNELEPFTLGVGIVYRFPEHIR